MSRNFDEAAELARDYPTFTGAPAAPSSAPSTDGEPAPVTASEILAEAERERAPLQARLDVLDATPRTGEHPIEGSDGLIALAYDDETAARDAEADALAEQIAEIDTRIDWARGEVERAERAERERIAVALAKLPNGKHNFTPSSPERLERMKEIYDAIAECWSNTKIAVVFSEKWGVSARQVQKLIRSAFDELHTDDERVKADRRNRLRVAVEEHYSKCLKAKEYTAAGQDLDRLARIDGCYVDRIEMTGAGGEPLKISVSTALDDLARAVAHVRERTAGALEAPEVIDAIEPERAP